MYSDIYYKLTPEERKSLDAYNKRILSSSKAVIIDRKFKSPKDFSVTSEISSPDSKLSAISTPKHCAAIKKTLAHPSSPKIQRSSSKYISIANKGSKYNYEIERFLKILYRHTNDCPKFKADIEGIGGLDSLENHLLGHKRIE